MKPRTETLIAHFGSQRRVKRAVCAALVALSCSAEHPRGSSAPVVAVSVPPQAYLVEQLAGDLVQVEVMIPPGANPAIYEPSVREMQALSQATLYVTVGHPAFPFEKAWLQPLLADLPHVTIVDGSPGEDHPVADPHVWLAPSLVKRMAQEIAQALIHLMPQHAVTVAGNLERLLADIDVLDAAIRETLGRVQSRRFVVFHPSWTHFAREYGLEQLAVEVEGKEPGPGELARLLEQLRAEKVTVIFTQPAVSPQSAGVIAAEVGASVQTLDPLARDWPEAMLNAATAIAKALQR